MAARTPWPHKERHPAPVESGQRAKPAAPARSGPSAHSATDAPPYSSVNQYVTSSSYRHTSGLTKFKNIIDHIKIKNM